jgi:hypothetical protein
MVIVTLHKKVMSIIYWLPLTIEPRELGSEIFCRIRETAFESFTETETGISDL